MFICWLLMKKNKDTIYAVSTPLGKSAIALIRISGKKAHVSVKKISKSMPTKANHAKANKLLDNKGKIIDQTITTYFKSPKSYTGEDMVEISLHGGSAVIKKFISVYKQNKDVRQAEPGEFTRRAFENNKLDLIQVEAVGDLINAETENQRKEAYKQLEGGPSIKLKKIHNKIINVLAEAEAIIDFTDEDLPKNIHKKIKEQIQNIIKEIEFYISSSLKNRKIQEGYIVGIVGKTNTGKSSFINYISNREISIVTSAPGTTRDVVQSYLDINGLPVNFYDSAGLRKSMNKIENIGIKKSRNLAENSDLNLVFIEKVSNINDFKKYKNNIFVQSKKDIRKKPIKNKSVVNISSFSGEGIEILLKNIRKNLTSKKYKEHESVSRERHIYFLNNAKKNLQNSKKNKNYDLFCEDIRMSLNEISKIYGKTDVEDILEIIFNDFCIGK